MPGTAKIKIKKQTIFPPKQICLRGGNVKNHSKPRSSSAEQKREREIERAKEKKKVIIYLDLLFINERNHKHVLRACMPLPMGCETFSRNYTLRHVFCILRVFPVHLAVCRNYKCLYGWEQRGERLQPKAHNHMINNMFIQKYARLFARKYYEE